MGTKKGQRRKTARRAYRTGKNQPRIKRERRGTGPRESYAPIVMQQLRGIRKFYTARKDWASPLKLYLARRGPYDSLTNTYPSQKRGAGYYGGYRVDEVKIRVPTAKELRSWRI